MKLDSRKIIFGNLVIAFLTSFIPVNVAADPITIQAGITEFPDPAAGPTTYVEFPFSIDRNRFTFVTEDGADGRVRASIYAEIILSDSMGNPVDSTGTYFYTHAHNMDEAQRPGVKIFNRLNMKLSPGKYSAKLTVIDAVNKETGSFLYGNIDIEPVVYDRLSLSTLELAYGIRLADDSSVVNERMVKNNREVITNPMGIYSTDDKELFTYVEVYNLIQNNTDPKFTYGYKVYRPDGTPQFDFGDHEVDKPGTSAVLTNRLNISGWGQGRYDLTLTVTDPASGKTVRRTSRFVIFPMTGPLPQMVTYTMKSPLDTMPLEKKEQLIRYLVTPEELVLFNSLNDIGRARYVDRFFKDKDPSPGTAYNEYLDEAIGRYLFTIEHFSAYPESQDGWNTDRGRVLMQYGQMDKRDEGLIPSGERPYEIWFYAGIQEGVYFVFVEQGGGNEYRLVHSNASGEVYDAIWQARVKDQFPEIIPQAEQFK